MSKHTGVKVSPKPILFIIILVTMVTPKRALICKTSKKRLYLRNVAM